MTAAEKFKAGLTALGYAVDEPLPGWCAVEYAIARGRFGGQIVKLAFEVPSDFELTPPHGPHMKPILFPVNQGASEHSKRMHPSPLGVEWGHLSRPFPNWPNTKRTVKEYMRWVTHLFESL